MERQQNNSAFSINKQLNYPRNTKKTVCHKMNLSRFIIIRLRFILKDKKTRYSLTAKLYLQSCLSGGDGGDVSPKKFLLFPPTFGVGATLHRSSFNFHYREYNTNNAISFWAIVHHSYLLLANWQLLKMHILTPHLSSDKRNSENAFFRKLP